MIAFVLPLVVIGVLTAAGVYLLLERQLTRMLLGLLLISNAINLLLLSVGGPAGNPPIVARTSGEDNPTADALVQALVLTAIVITMGVAAFVLALTYRSFRINTAEEVGDDPEDARVSQLSEQGLDEDTRLAPAPDASRDTDLPDELDALPGHEGSR
ncbi:Na(+)/H(+) antiporter subunit C [Micromonospora sp. WMMD737]|uniref:Na(+)/H(+) antiporter subunit C n=1 Tax=Micromonospora sp. WMMD737 TaxID=3404113 RepID=UPI003B943A66